jgi:hypothetical protein
MSITNNINVSQNVYCIQSFYYAESTRKNISYAQEMTRTEETVEQVYRKKTNDVYIANTGGLRKFYSMSSSNSMIVLCEVRYLNTSRNLNHNVVKRQYRHSAHQRWDSVLASVICTNLEAGR